MQLNVLYRTIFFNMHSMNMRRGLENIIRKYINKNKVYERKVKIFQKSLYKPPHIYSEKFFKNFNSYWHLPSPTPTKWNCLKLKCWYYYIMILLSSLKWLKENENDHICFFESIANILFLVALTGKLCRCLSSN